MRPYYLYVVIFYRRLRRLFFTVRFTVRFATRFERRLRVFAPPKRANGIGAPPGHEATVPYGEYGTGFVETILLSLCF